MKRPSSDPHDFQSVRPGRSPLPRDLVRALEWLKPRLSEPIRLEDIAIAAGVPSRTLETHFRIYLSVTPLGWVRRARLARARQQLLEGGRKAGVTEIAMASGFSQLGRFAKQYRELYGERPSQTQARACGVDDSDAIDDEATFLAWRALSSAYFVAPKECGRALDDVERAQEIAPAFGLPKGIMAWCNGQRTAFNFRGTARVERCEIARCRRERRRADTERRLDAERLQRRDGARPSRRRCRPPDRARARARSVVPARMGAARVGIGLSR